MGNMKTCMGFHAALLVGLAPRVLFAESATTSASVSGPSASATLGTELPPNAAASRAPVELGFLGGLYFPSKDHSLVGSGFRQEPFKSPAPEIGGRAALLPIAYGGIEVEGAVMPAKTDSGHNGGFFAIRGHLLGQVPLGAFTPFAVVGLGSLGAGSTTTGTGADLAYHFGLGAKYALDDFLALRLDLRDTLSPKLGGSGQTSSPEVLLGLTFMIGRSKKEAPPVPAKAADADGDGKLDPEDKCPNEAASTPDGCPIRDTDGDGVLDDKDACPAEPGKAPCGCPLRDQDGDKIIDELDKCPSVPGPLEGCPDPDADRDGVPVPDDKCPDQQETKNGFQDSDGCPDEVPEKVKKFTGVIQGIEFDRGKDTIRPVSLPTLDAAAAVLAEYPALRLLISGHTDSDGDPAFNVDLSKRRAESVKAYFVTKGIQGDRVETRGVGPDEPIADNKTGAGKQKNRRIEFKLLSEPPAPSDAPATLVPPARGPSSSAPSSPPSTSTSAPSAPVPSASGPSTPAPSTSAPSTSASAPSTSASAPSTSAPSTSGPSAPAPSTPAKPASESPKPTAPVLPAPEK
jgi:outer membrane protein OmpA-like peptidoglycan-associated protein